MAVHHFHLHADWPGSRNGVGRITAGSLTTEVSIPPEMNGPGIGTNPDEMLLGASATCYIITLAAMLEKSKLKKERLSMNSEGVVEVAQGIITYQKIIHRPQIVLPASASDRDIALAKKLAVKAEASCMISRALQGNVDIQLQAAVKRGS
ncbi:OsmC family protein [Bacillus xiapuensis]|uniref:OsmC family protein n=1 Tax=Bacillus xiapuensis TaxID=2014075 RepID=UPI000C240A49|nr:OsmC family protein [Bacillus xiapuensis]